MRHLAAVADRDALKYQVNQLRKAGSLTPGDLDALAEAVTHEAYGTVAALVSTLIPNGTDRWASEASPQAAEGESLRDEVRALGEKLTQLEDDEAELQRTIHTFSARYRNELGPLVAKLLRLRKEQATQSLYAQRSDRRRRDARNQAEAQFDRFQSVLDDVDEQPPAPDLSDDEQSQLKATFRRASKQCHPDMVDPLVEEEARTYFNELREAYQQNDVERVEEIAQSLEDSGFAHRSARDASPRSQLEAQAERLRQRIASVEASIRDLQTSEAYRTVERTNDLDAYFDALKQKLRHEIRRLHRRRRVS